VITVLELALKITGKVAGIPLLCFCTKIAPGSLVTFIRYWKVIIVHRRKKKNLVTVTCESYCVLQVSCATVLQV